jgi:hypothetical protein
MIGVGVGDNTTALGVGDNTIALGVDDNPTIGELAGVTGVVGSGMNNITVPVWPSTVGTTLVDATINETPATNDVIVVYG